MLWNPLLCLCFYNKLQLFYKFWYFSKRVLTSPMLKQFLILCVKLKCETLRKEGKQKIITDPNKTTAQESCISSCLHQRMLHILQHRFLILRPSSRLLLTTESLWKQMGKRTIRCSYKNWRSKLLTFQSTWLSLPLFEPLESNSLCPFQNSNISQGKKSQKKNREILYITYNIFIYTYKVYMCA